LYRYAQGQVASAYKRALLRYHPDRAAARAADERERVHAEEVFKLVTKRHDEETRR
jgi:DnaJ-class molecular chaperone